MGGLVENEFLKSTFLQLFHSHNCVNYKNPCPIKSVRIHDKISKLKAKKNKSGLHLLPIGPRLILNSLHRTKENKIRKVDSLSRRAILGIPLTWGSPCFWSISRIAPHHVSSPFLSDYTTSSFKQGQRSTLVFSSQTTASSNFKTVVAFDPTSRSPNRYPLGFAKSFS